MLKLNSAPLTVLTAVGGDADDEVAITVAAGLARRHQTTAIAVNAFSPMPAAALAPPVSRSVMGPQILTALASRRDDVDHAIHDLVAAQNGRAGRTVIRLADPAPSVWMTLMRELPLVDICVLAQSSTTGDGAWIGPLGDALMDARTPVYLARDTTPVTGRTVAIAWDGSFEAARALRAAAPLLREASDIAILQDTDHLDIEAGARADPTRLAAWLEARNLPPTRYVEAKGGKVGPMLLEAAGAVGAALLVAGAYRHSRLFEALFGGVTRSLLQAAEGPHLLIAH